jgi:hypothetical protein
MMMQPVAVMPLHDPEGRVLPLLEKVTPQLKRIFGQAFMYITAATRESQATWVNWIERERFFQVTNDQPGAAIGEQFWVLYTAAVNSYPAEQILHLCFPDRVVFALLSAYREQFIADVQATTGAYVPLLFQRSEKAWRTHPKNYREIEQLATRVGELLLNRAIDWIWCHLAARGRQLQQLLPQIEKRDLSMLAEILLQLGAKLNSQDVDWLAWEDPFISGREAGDLRRERESSVAETQKRLAYIIPTLHLLAETAGG